MMKQQLYSELRTIYETDERDPHTFRITVKMKDLIDGDLLRTAVDQTIKRYPYFAVRLCSDGNEVWLEENPEPVPVQNHNERIVLGSEQTSGHLIAVSYWKNRLFLNAFHGLTDGGGMAPFIRTLLYYYCSAFYEEVAFSTEGIRLSDDTVDPLEWVDPADREYPENGEMLVPKWNRPAFQIGSAGIAHLIPDSIVYNMRVSEEEFMRFNISNDGSPATIVALLLARTIESFHRVADDPVVIAMCVNQRKALKAPLAHQSLVGDVRLPFTEKLKKLDFTSQATCFRGMVTLQSSEDMVLQELREYREVVEKLKAMPTIRERQEFCVRRMEDLSKCVTATVSYVGKANYGEFEKYIQEYEALPSTALPSTHVPLTVEMSAMNGYFFLNFIQFFHEPDYFSEFVKQFRYNNINYDVLNVAEARYSRMHFPWEEEN